MPTWVKSDDDLTDFRRELFTADASSTPGDATKPVYWIGEGPGVIVMPEMPGLIPEVAAFARRLAGEGFTVAVPSLFGTPGRAGGNGVVAQVFPKACISKEFVAFSAGSTSPVTGWLRALAVEVHERCGGPGIGVMGMCFTGGFVLGLAVDASVLVAVMGQPALPMPVTKKLKADLGVSPDDLAAAKANVAAGTCVIGLRFTNDPIVPAERFATMRREFGDGFIGVEFDSSKGNPHGFPKDAHSALTHEYSDTPGHPTREAYELVVKHMKDRLIPG